jgi:TolB-like protein
MGAAERFGGNKGRRLDSWKAIAQFLDRDIRSVQRWEHERGLPVYRLPGQKGAVFAFEGELEGWMRSGDHSSSGPPTTRVEGLGSPRSATAAVSSPKEAAPRQFTRFAAMWIAAAVLGMVLGVIAFEKWKRPVLPAPPSTPTAIAVLPMQNLSGDATQDYFADGFTEELVTELAQLRSLRVISRTSTMIYKGSRKSLPQIARELHAKYIVEGSVLREGDRVRVIAQLIDATTDIHVSARTYNTDLKDIMDVQAQISRAIAQDVRLDLSPEEKARLASAREFDPEAHDLYLKASYQFAQQTPASIRQSLALYQAAAAKAPTFARAYVGIAQAEAALLQITAESPDVSAEHEKSALARALAIDPHLGEARGLLASLIYWHDWDWPRAEREFRVALADGAQAPTEQRFGFALLSRGRFEEANTHLRGALELDPLGKSPRVNYLQALLMQRKFAEARRETSALLSTSPNFLAGHVLLGLDATAQHDCSLAAAEAAWIEQHFPSSLADIMSAFASSCRGDFPAARRSVEKAATSKGPAFASPYQIALGYICIHDREAAFSYLEKSVAMHEPQALFLKVEFLFDPLRFDPRYIAMERKVGLLQ